MFGSQLHKSGSSGAKAPSNGRYRNGNDHLIELHDVVKTYRSAAGKFSALKGIDLEVDGGEFVAVIGKSGSGKSTLVNMITGIDRPTSGEILMGDTAIQTLKEGKLAEWRGRSIGVIFQFFQLLPTLTAAENIMLPMDFCHMYSTRERRQRAMLLLSAWSAWPTRRTAALDPIGRPATARGHRAPDQVDPRLRWNMTASVAIEPR